jgi:hypothetical protein
MEADPNVVLYVGEVAFGDRPFEVTSADEPHDLQLRTADELWLKENVLNLVVQRFPQSAKYIAYLDGDITMSRYDWALEAVHLLQHYKAVQLMSQFTDLDSHHRPIAITRGFAYSYANHICPSEYQKNIFGFEPLINNVAPIDNHGNQGETKIDNPHIIEVSNNNDCDYGIPPCETHPHKSFWGATGLGWAFRKETWEEMNGLLDICILGSADWHMAYGMAGLANIYQHEDFTVEAPYVSAIKNWQNHAVALKSDIWYMDNLIIHNWHGPKVNRFYRERARILVENKFDPYKDLKRDWQGLLRLSDLKPKLRDDIRAYFRARNEDDRNLGIGQKPLR